jgi:hypothetical protein
MEALIRPGHGWRNWTDRGNMVAWGILPTAKDKTSLYITRHFRHQSNHLQRATLRSDGFASVHAPYQGGEMLTVPLTFAGNRLCLNYASSAAGAIRVEIQDYKGEPLPGFTLAEAVPSIGDEIEGVVRWKSGNCVGELAGRPIRLRFLLQDCDLYSMRFEYRDSDSE